MLHITPGQMQLSSCMSKVDEILADAYALREKLRSQLASIEKSIAAFEQMKSDIPPDDLDGLLTRRESPRKNTESQTRAVEVSPDLDATTPAEVVVLAQQELLSVGRPMKRGALVRALEKRGVRLAGKDKNKNLGTILWRRPDMFISLERLGYWVKGVPLDGVYDPTSDIGSN